MPRQVARQIESTDPRLREDLLSAVELSDPQTANGSSVCGVGFKRVWPVAPRESRSVDLLPIGLIQRWLLAGLIVALVFAALLMVPQMQFGRRIARAMLPGIPIERASLTDITILKPSPPSGYVAEGDAVAVLVQIGGRGGGRRGHAMAQRRRCRRGNDHDARVASPTAANSGGTLAAPRCFRRQTFRSAPRRSNIESLPAMRSRFGTS